MKRRGSTLIEIICAMTIFLITILPVIYLTMSSLKTLKKTSEISERSRISTSVINYIKSRGYNVLFNDNDSDSGFSWDSDGGFSQTYTFKFDETESAFVLDNESGLDFEKDFFGNTYYNSTNSTSDALFIMNSLGINLEGATLNISMKKSGVYLTFNDSLDSDYINPITNSASNTLIGNGGIIKDEVIIGQVTINYVSKADTSVLSNKTYSENFILMPLENFN